MANWVIIGVTVIVVVLLVLFAIDRWGIFEDDRTGDPDGTDRVKTEARREGDYSVGWMKKHKQLTLPGKVVSVAVGLLLVSTLVYAYFTLKSGAPVEVPYARGIQGGVIGTVGLFAGIALANKRNSARGRLEITYEDDAGNEDDVEVVYFDPEETVTNSSGRPVVKEHFETRILGLFGRRKLVAHDRELRSERTVLSDVVGHEIPAHAIEIEPNVYQFRTQERETKSSPSTAADYKYRSPVQLHYQTYLEQQERLKKMQMRLDTMAAKLGEAQSELVDLRRRLESREYRDAEKVREEFKEIMEILPSRSKSYTVTQDQRSQRSPTSQKDLADLDETRNGGAES